MTAQTAAAPIPRRAWHALAVVSLSIFVVVLDTSVVNVAFPTISEDLDADASRLSWIISAYTITIAAFLLVAGRVADRVGRRRVFAVAIATFGLGSLLSGLAPSVEALIAFRVVQALGAAAIFPSSLALVLPEFPPRHRSTAIGIWGSMAGAGGAVGPTLGALLIEAASWRAIFLINVPITLVVLALIPRLLTESREPPPHRRLDLLGVPAGTAGIALLTAAIVQSEQWGLVDARTLGLAAAGMALIPAVVVRSRRHPAPLLDLDLFRVRSFWTATVGVGCFGMAFLAGFLTNSLLLQDLWDYGVLQTGLALSPAPLLVAVVASATGLVADRVGHRWLIATGCALASASFVYLRLAVGPEPDYVRHFLPANLLLGLGVGLSISTFASASLRDVDETRLASATATIRTVQQMSYALGVAVVVTLLGSSTPRLLEDFQRAWAWEIAVYATAGILVALLYPRRAAPSDPAGGHEAQPTPHGAR